MENYIVSQSNDLVLATYTMTTKEKQLLLACVSQIDSREGAREITKQTKFTITVEQIRDVFYNKGNDKNLFRDLSEVSARLQDRKATIHIAEGDKLVTNFVSAVRFQKFKGRVILTFAEDILPYLTELKANFTKYRLIEISQLSSTHAIRLYELIVCWTGLFTYKQEFELDDFRYVMGVSGKYKQFGQLKESVIDKAIAEINEHTDFNISVEYRKVGRTFVSMTLRFHKKSLAKLEDKKGKISEEMLSAIVRSNQFEADYNDYHRLSGQGKRDRDAFRSEMKNFIATYPEDFEEKPLENYLK
ncbi:replication initiation protein [Psychrobacter sp. AOP5-GZ1-6]|uniref:replication initiation protein n=1 Tax=unclassified Psychrobacter TaxID=196806 RepID=UPI00402B6B9E